MPLVANLVQVGDWPRTHREQLASLARATPAAMAGYAINTSIAVWAFYTAIPKLLLWAASSRLRELVRVRDLTAGLRFAQHHLIGPMFPRPIRRELRNCDKHISIRQ